MKNTGKIVALLAAGGVVLGTVACSGGGGTGVDDVTLTYVTTLPENAPVEGMREAWAEDLADATDGAVEVNAFYSDSLVPATESLTALADGRADMAYVCNTFEFSQLPLYDLATLPWVTRDAGAFTGALDQLARENDAFRAEFENAGVRPLFFVPLQSATMHLNAPFDEVSDLRGKRIRSSSYPAEMIQAAGGQAVFLSFAEVYEAFQRGTIDGVFPTAFDNATNVGLPELAPEYIDTGAGQFASCFVGISERRWATMNEDTQQAILDAAERARDRNLELFEQAEADTCDALLEAGGSVVLADPEVIEQWKDEAGYEGFFEDWAAAAEEAGVPAADAASFRDDYLALIEELTSQSDRIDGLTACRERTE